MAVPLPRLAAQVWVALAALERTTSAVHVAFIAPPASHYAPMLPTALGLMDQGHQVSFLGYDETIKKIEKVVPKAKHVVIGTSPLDKEKMAPVLDFVQSLPYEYSQIFSNFIVPIMGALMGGHIAEVSKPLLAELKPDVLCVSYAYPVFYALGEVLGIPLVGIGWGTPSWITSHADMPWAVEPNVGSIHTRQELYDDPLLLAANTAIRMFGWVMNRVGSTVNMYWRYRIGHSRPMDLWEFDATMQHPMVIMTLPELTAGNPTSLGPYTFMVGILDHPAMGGSGMAKSDDQEKIMAWLDEQRAASTQVLYVAFGSEIRMPAHLANLLVQAFRLGGFTVLWASKVKPQVEVPDNVLVTKFAPQRAVLNHPAVVAFLSHGGMNSVNEALAFGKPLAIMPFFGDQMMVAATHRDLGVAVMLDKTTTNAQELVDAIRTVSTEKYRKRSLEVKKLIDQRSDLSRAVQVIENQATGKFHLHIPPCPHVLMRLIPMWATLIIFASFCSTCCCIRCWPQLPCGCCVRCCRGAGSRKKEKTQ